MRHPESALTLGVRTSLPETSSTSAPWRSLLRKLVVVILSIVVLVALGVYVGYARHERETLVSGKVATAATVLDFLAESLAPSLVFSDDQAVASDLDKLPSSADLISVEVWSLESAQPRLAGEAPKGVHSSRPPASFEPGVSILPDRFIITTIINGEHAPKVGLLRATFSLDKANATIAANTHRALIVSTFLAIGVAAVLLAAVQQSLLRPMREMRMARELEIAANIQRALLPLEPRHAEFRFAGSMIAADEVGGDFYDVHSNGDALWITVGDVSGHGLPAGLVMLMAQAAFAAHFRAAPDAEPKEVYQAVNSLLWENVARRLQDDKYVTCQLLAYRGQGKFAVVGGHQALLIYRRKTRRSEVIEAPGPWLGILAELPDFATHALELEPGDVLCLYSDGIIEARNRAGEVYDLHRLQDAVDEALGKSSDLDLAMKQIVNHVLEFCPRPQDDASLLLVARNVC